jgi:hypothetical protein
VQRGADVGSGHFLARFDIKLKLKKLRRKTKTSPLDIHRLKEQTTIRSFQTEVKKNSMS